MLHPENLLTSATCGPLTLKNRLLAAPIVTGFEYRGDLSLLTEKLVSFARDGTSMVTVCAGVVHASGKPLRLSKIYTEMQQEQHKKLTDAVHQEDCHVILQLIHAGPKADVWFPISTHHHRISGTKRFSHAARNYTLQKIVKAYVDTAKKAIQAGYDGVEILGSGSTLPAVFLSPTTNHRKDAWGVNQLGRFKLSLDIVRGVRKGIGDQKAIGFRFNLMELLPTGANWDEILRFIQVLRISGVDYLCADFGGSEARIPTNSFTMPTGVWNEAYELLAQNTELKVVFGHRFGNFEKAEQLAQAYPNSLFELSDEFLGDSQYIHKNLGLLTENVYPWISLDDSVHYNDIHRSDPLFNPLNPFDFCSIDNTLSIVDNPKKISVVGAGPAGIYFSLIASLRGHHVDLYEKNSFIGGGLKSLYKIYTSDNISSWIKILEDKVNLSTINLHLNTKASISSLLSQSDTDLTVIATGFEPKLLDIPGIESSNVMMFDEMLQENLPIGKRVAVLGATPVALSICRYLLNHLQENKLTPKEWRQAWGVGNPSEHNGGVLGFIPEIDVSPRLVYLVETQPNQISQLSKEQSLNWDYKWLLMNGMRTLDNVNIEAIDNHAVRVSFGAKHIDRFALRIDHVVVCAGVLPNDDCVTQLTLHQKKHLCIGVADIKNTAFSLDQTIQNAIQAALEC